MKRTPRCCVCGNHWHRLCAQHHGAAKALAAEHGYTKQQVVSVMVICARARIQYRPVLQCAKMTDIDPETAAQYAAKGHATRRAMTPAKGAR